MQICDVSTCTWPEANFGDCVFVSLSNVSFERQVLIGSSFCAQMVAVCVADGGAANTHQSDSKSFLLSGLRSVISFT